MLGQLRSDLPGGGYVLSRAQRLDDGFRAALLGEDGLFRFDVQAAEDTLRTFVRLPDGVDAHYLDEPASGAVVLTGADAEALLVRRPMQLSLAFVAASGPDESVVRILVGVLHDPATAQVELTGQAIVRPYTRSE